MKHLIYNTYTEFLDILEENSKSLPENDDQSEEEIDNLPKPETNPTSKVKKYELVFSKELK